MKRLLGTAFATMCLLMIVSEQSVAQPLAVQQQALKKNAQQAPTESTLEDALRPAIQKVLREELAREGEDDTPDEDSEKGGSDPFADLIDGARTSVETLSKNFQRSIDGVPELPGQFRERAFLLLTDFNGWPRMWEGIFNLLAMLIAGGLAAGAIGRLLHRILVIPENVPEYGFARLAVAAVLLVRGIVLTAIFAAVGFLVSLVWFAQFDPMRIFLITYLGAASMGYLGWNIAGFLLAPGRPSHRMVDVSDGSARKLAVWLTAVFLVIGLAGFSVGMVRLLGMAEVTFDILLQVSGLLVTAATALLILTTSTGSRAPSSGSGMMSGLFSRYRTAWLWIGLVAFLLFWMVGVLSGDGTRAAAVLVALMASGLMLWFGNLKPVTPPVTDMEPVGAVIPIDPEDAAAQQQESHFPEPEPEPETAAMPDQPRKSVLPSFSFVARCLLGVLVGLSVLHLLGVDMVAAFQSPMGQRVSLILLDVAIILVVAAICWALVERTVNRFVRQEEERAMALAADAVTDEDGLGGLVTSRFGTLLPLIRGFILSVLVAVTIMVVLSSMGLDIGPLLAGAGVVGIAIGFGAQALVRDIISGIFFLIDDAFRVGEYVEFGEIRGQVEQISIRSMRLRHHRGAIHTIPFGELRSITNYNRDWAIYKQEFRLHYEVNTDQVRKIIKKVGLRLMEDPELGPKFIQPLKSQGVFKIEEGALILRTKFMCKPREQFIIRKAVFQEVKNDLYKAGIELAQRRVQIDWPDWMQETDGEPPEGMEPDNQGGATPPAAGSPPANKPTPAAVAAAAGAAQIATENRTKPVYPDEP
jgi:small-conductance mechanosensitive channel